MSDCSCLKECEVGLWLNALQVVLSGEWVWLFGGLREEARYSGAFLVIMKPESMTWLCDPSFLLVMSDIAAASSTAIVSPSLTVRSALFE